VDQYLAQLVPNTESSLSRGGQFNNINALVALVDKIGPAILVVHSQSGAYGALTAIARPSLVRAVVDVEGYGACQLTPQQTSALGQVPILVVAGDHAWNGDASCRSMVKTLNTAGGNAAFFATYEHGWHGNTHLLMMDTNNLQIADWILDWLRVVAPFPVAQVGPASGR
jgi:pimeloyl-ACP methyl ester carboxylesterase